MADGAREARDARVRARARQPCGASPVVEGANAGTGRPAAGRRLHRPAAELRAAELEVCTSTHKIRLIIIGLSTLFTFLGNINNFETYNNNNNNKYNNKYNNKRNNINN